MPLQSRPKDQGLLNALGGAACCYGHRQVYSVWGCQGSCVGPFLTQCSGLLLSQLSAALTTRSNSALLYKRSKATRLCCCQRTGHALCWHLMRLPLMIRTCVTASYWPIQCVGWLACRAQDDPCRRALLLLSLLMHDLHATLHCQCRTDG